MKYTFKTKLSIEECKSGIAEALRDKSDDCDLIKFFRRFNKPTIAKANKHNNKFWARSPRGGGRDSWERVFHGKFIARGNYTTIEGKFKMPISAILFTVLIGTVYLTILAGIIANGNIKYALIPIVMLIILLLTVFAGIEGSKQRTLEFIINTFKAEELLESSRTRKTKLKNDI